MTDTASQIPSHEAEIATSLLFRTLGAHRSAIAALAPERPGRLQITTDGDPLQDRRQATLVRLLSITESFATELLSRELDRFSMQAGNSTVTKIVNEAIDRAIGTWAEQKRAYKDWLGVTGSWTKVEQLAEARNAVAHGLGNLTRRQLKNESGVMSKLREAGIAVNNRMVILTEDNLQAAAVACRDFIELLDIAVQTKR